jgi:hypothetical protein
VVDQLGNDGKVNVGLEEREAYLAQGVRYILVGDRALAPEGLEGAL